MGFHYINGFFRVRKFTDYLFLDFFAETFLKTVWCSHPEATSKTGTTRFFFKHLYSPKTGSSFAFKQLLHVLSVDVRKTSPR